MIPVGSENLNRRFPLMTCLILAALFAMWILVQGAGLNATTLARSVCNLGMVPGELTGLARLNTAVPIGRGLWCTVDQDPINVLTPLLSIFLHGGWGHLLGNALFFWVFGKTVEDSMGRLGFLGFFLLCGLTAAAAQVALSPASPVPMVGASGAISGIMGAHLLLHPRVRIKVLFFFFIFIRVVPLPAWLILVWWFGLQVLGALPELNVLNPEISGGTAFGAHVGGFTAGLLMVKFFAKAIQNPVRFRAA